MKEDLVINEDIMERAEKILAYQKRLTKYVELCLAAEICPKCGGT
jgi:hypothetical protein